MFCSMGLEVNITILSLRNCVVAPTVSEVNKLSVAKKRDVPVYNYWRKNHLWYDSITYALFCAKTTP